MGGWMHRTFPLSRLYGALTWAALWRAACQPTYRTIIIALVVQVRYVDTPLPLRAITRPKVTSRSIIVWMSKKKTLMSCTYFCPDTCCISLRRYPEPSHTAPLSQKDVCSATCHACWSDAKLDMHTYTSWYEAPTREAVRTCSFLDVVVPISKFHSLDSFMDTYFYY